MHALQKYCKWTLFSSQAYQGRLHFTPNLKPKPAQSSSNCSDDNIATMLASPHTQAETTDQGHDKITAM